MRFLAIGVVVALAVFAIFFARSRRGSTWDVGKLPAPWGDRPSIYAHVKSHLPPSGAGLTAGGEELPDEDRFSPDGAIRWAPGARDGVFGHHVGATDEGLAATEIVDAIRNATRLPSAQALKRAYELLSDEKALALVDPILEAALARKDLDLERLRSFARWVVTGAPDRTAVKIGLALLGIFRGDADRDLFLTLGRHDEFTLFSAVALQNSLADPEPALFELAKSVDGWGRIQTVERLKTTKDPGVKRWMLREGYKNSIMYEYLAHLCATVGDLRSELDAPEVDDALLAGAGDILRALVTGQGGPAEGIDDYPDGAIVTTHYLRHLRGHLSNAPLRQLMALSTLRGFVDEPDEDWGKREPIGWTPEVRREVRAQSEALIAAPRWRELVNNGLTSSDDSTFSEASEAAKVLGIDTWERHFARASAGVDGGSWFEISKTRDRERMVQVVALAERVLPLERIATGPGTELGIGPQWRPHGDLDFVLQELGRFPGLGWNLVRTGLRSRVTRNRNMALRALSEWGPQRWPADARPLLVDARAREPDADVRKRIDRILDGKKFDE